MAVDINRVVAKAVEAAFADEHDHGPQRNHHRGIKALAAGAALVATARVVSNHAPKLSKLAALGAVGKAGDRLPDLVRDVPDRVRDLLAPDHVADEEDLDEDEADFDEQQGDEGPDDEGGDWPEDEEGGDLDGGDDAAEPEPEEEEEQRQAVASGEESAIEQAAEGLDVDTNGHRASQGGAPDVIAALSGRKDPPPLRTRSGRRRSVDPASRPPEPPSSKSGPAKSGKTAKSGKKKAKAGGR